MGDHGMLQAPLPAQPQRLAAPAPPVPGQAPAAVPGRAVAAVPPPAARRRRRRNNRKRKRVSRYLPKRPKKAASAYSMFLKSYYRQLHRAPLEAVAIGPRERLRRASAQWQTTTANQRAAYVAECARDKERYRREITMWKRQKAFLKRPASAYALFLKDNWAAERANLPAGDRIQDVGKRISAHWAILAPEHKAQYKARYTELVGQHRQKITNLRLGRPLPELDEAAVVGRGPVMPPVAGVPEPNVPDEDQDQDEDMEEDDEQNDDDDDMEDEE